MPITTQLQQAQQAQQAPQGVLSVTPEVPKEDTKSEGQGKKTVIVNLGQQAQ
jgi:hypothetical protein